MVYNYENLNNIFYDNELLTFNYYKLNVFILIHFDLYILIILQYVSIHLKSIFHIFHIF